MAYTGHGYHISGTNRGEGITKAGMPTGCGGPEAGCPRCLKDIEDYKESMIGSDVDYQERAKRLLLQHLHNYYLGRAESTNDLPPSFTVYIEMFSKTLRNWKAIMGTTLDDCMIYVLTYDAENEQTYLTSYHKNEDITIPD